MFISDSFFKCFSARQAKTYAWNGYLNANFRGIIDSGRELSIWGEYCRTYSFF